MKNLITILLLVCLIGLPVQARPEPPPPPEDSTVIIGCVVLAVGTVVVIGLWKLCNKILPPTPPVTPPPPPPTNPPPIINPTNAPPTNPPPKPPWWKRPFALLSVGDEIAGVNVASLHYRDQISGGEYGQMIWTSLQSSTNEGRSWQTECTITGWVSQAGAFIGYWTNGAPALTTYTMNSPATVTNYVPLEIGTGNEPSKLFRVKGL